MHERFVGGQKFSPNARTLNAWSAAADAHAQAQGQRGLPDKGRETNSGLVTIQNTTGALVDQGAILGIDSVANTVADDPDGFKNAPLLVGVAPSATDHAGGRFVITIGPIDDDDFGRAIIVGQVAVQVDIKTAGDRYADIDDGEVGNLDSNDNGGPVRILYVEAGTGVKWAIVKMGSDDASTAGPGWIGGKIRSFVFQVVGDVAWADVDEAADLDFNDSIIIGVAYQDAGTVAAGGDPVDDYSEWWDNGEASWITQDTDKPFHSYIPGNTFVAKDIYRCQYPSRGDLNLRAGTDGKLEARVENYSQDFFVQIMFVVGRSPVDDPITLGA